jgi:HEAT repeat protein
MCARASVSVFSAVSDPVLRIALWGGVLATALTAVVALVIVLLRLALLRDERRWQAFVSQWRPRLLSLVIETTAAPLPVLPAADRRRFLRLWLYLHESVRGEAADRLNTAALELGLDNHARALLAGGSRTARLQAVLALGHLRDRTAWAPLQRLAGVKDPLLSINAARALVRIDALRAAEVLTPMALQREDWDVGRLVGFMADARDAFGLMLVRRLPGLQPHQVPRALRLARALRLNLPTASLQRLLRQQPAPAVVRAVLPLLRGPGFHDDVLSLLQHPDAGVRAEALRAMADLAVPADLPRISALLHDGDVDVRLSSAQTLTGLPFLSDSDLRALAAPAAPGHAELQHALAERDWRGEAK